MKNFVCLDLFVKHYGSCPIKISISHIRKRQTQIERGETKMNQWIKCKGEYFFEKFNKIVEEGNRRSKLSATQMEEVR